MRATASLGVLLGLAQFGLHAGGYRVGEPVLPVAGGVQVDQCGPAGRVAHALHEFAEVSPGLRNQRIAGVAQVVKVNVHA
jgi:hypothetical protein